jgi:hypothetical protein
MIPQFLSRVGRFRAEFVEEAPPNTVSSRNHAKPG